MSRPVLVLIAVLLTPAPALACGGFFCNVVDPVIQTAERVLFRVNDDGTVTTVVEIQFAGPPTEVGWVLPIPEQIDPEAVGTAPVGLFDDLERLTAPRFLRPVEEGAADAAFVTSAGCGGCGPGGWGGEWGGFVEPTGVEVVGEAVVGPYAVEIITAEDGQNLTLWLQMNGYQIPSTASEPMSHYVTSGMTFLGIKLLPDVPQGPIEAIAFTYAADEPMLPLILTSVAAAEDMEVIAYVLADERYAPANYTDVDFDHSVVRWVDDEETDYDEILPLAMDYAGGRAFVTEYASAIEVFADQAGEPSAELLGTAAYLTRFRTMISPTEMTIDPVWQAAPDLGDVSNVHTISEEGGSMVAAAGPALILLAILVGLGRRRRD